MGSVKGKLTNNDVQILDVNIVNNLISYDENL